MSSRNRNIQLLAAAVFLLVTGYSRDFIFKSINALLKAWDYNMDYSMPSGMRFFENMQYENIEKSKWVLTAVFTVIYLTIALFVIRLLFSDKRYLRYTVLSYAAIMAASGVLMLAGTIIPSLSGSMYEFSRYLMGMAQSPLILMILIPAFKLSAAENTNIKN